MKAYERMAAICYSSPIYDFKTLIGKNSLSIIIKIIKSSDKNYILHFVALVRADCTITSTSELCSTVPKKISEWFEVLAQSNIQAKVSFVSEMESCNELPLKVEVQAKQSPGSDFIFPGSGITERTDQSDSPYGGVVYKYKADGNILIMVPKQDTGKPSGVSLFSGK